MCLKHSKAAKRIPERRGDDLATSRERRRIPYMKPLYWKWMWSIIRRPGERRMDRAIAWAERLVNSGELATSLIIDQR